jgi:hypothetical protein
MVAPTNANPTLSLILPAYDASGHQVNVAIRVTNVQTDGTTNVVYGDLTVGGTVTANNASIGATESPVPTSATLIAANDNAGNLEELLLESNANPNLRVALFQGANQLVVDASGRVTALVSSNTATGAATPTNAFFVGITDNTNLQGWKQAVQAANTSGTGIPGVGIMGFDGSNIQFLRTAGAGDGVNSAIAAAQYVYNGTNTDRRRTPTTFKTATATASGDTALWTPTSGKKFRLMRFILQITADAATSGGADIDIILRDATTGLAAALTVFVPAAAGTTFGATVTTGWIDWGNGYLSTAANNVLNINLSAALTSGKVRAIAVGTEE